MAGGSDETNVTPTQTAPWKPQRDQLEYLFNETRNEYERARDAPEMPQTYAGPNQGIQDAWAGLSDFANGNQVYENAQGGWMDLMNSMDVGNNSLVQRQVEEANNQMMQGFRQQVIPSINADAVGVGQVGSSRQGMVQGMATQGLADAMQESSTNIMTNAYDIGSRNVQSAVDMAPSMYNLGVSDDMLLGQIAQDQQRFQQAELDDAYNRRVADEQRTADLLSTYKALISGGYGGTTTPQDEGGGALPASRAEAVAAANAGTLPPPGMYPPTVPGIPQFDVNGMINNQLQSNMVDPQSLYNPPLTT